MAKITIDNREYEVDARKNMLAVALSLGYNLPYFCWHPCLDSVGACRQCAIKQYKNADDEQGAIAMACMVPASEGSRISINDPEARDFRASVIEWLMINHPHDCPVCEEGGECHLQDMTLMTGHTRRRYRGSKRTHRNQDLGPFINHEMNRCIACYRCTRFYRDYAGGNDLESFGAHDNVYFGRAEDGTLENEFSGNLVEVCPTGVFTDKTLGAHYTRKWDLQNAPGICQHCSLGCNTSPASRQGVLKRIQNRYHGEINGYFLCDRGRFGAGFVNREDRPRQPLIARDDGILEAADNDHARDHLAGLLREAKGIVGIGSPRASLEGNYALRRLVGEANYSHGMGAREAELTAKTLDLLRAHPAANTTLRKVEDCDAVLVLGEDVLNTAPRLALSLRQSIRRAQFDAAEQAGIPRWHERGVRDIGARRKSPLFLATPTATKLDELATGTLHARPAEIAKLGFAVAHALDAAAPAPDGLDDATQALAKTIAEALSAAENPLVVAGHGCGDPATLDAAGNVIQALEAKRSGHGKLFLTLGECNSAGAGLIGGLSVEDALAKLESGAADTVVVVENDLYAHAPRARVDAALAQAANVIVIDHSMHATIAKATMVLPAGSFAEADGTLVNNEGRAQRFFQVYVPDAPIQESWRWCAEMLAMTGSDPQWTGLDEVLAALGEDLPQLSGAQAAAPDAAYRQAGMRFPRAPHRFSGRTALYANESVHERRPTPDVDSPLSFSMEGWPGQRPAALIPFAWTPGWNSNQQAITRFQEEIAGPLRGSDPGAQLLKGAGAAGSGAYRAAEVHRGDGWLALPLHHVFGSEPLSALAPAVAERVPAPYFALNTADAEALNLAEGGELELALEGVSHRLPVRLVDSLPARTVGVPVGLGGLPASGLPLEIAPENAS